MTHIVSILRRIYRRLPEAPSTNFAFRRPDLNPYALMGPGARVVDLGSKDARGRYAFGAPPEDAQLICVDICDGPNVDIVADAADLHMIDGDSVDGVFLVDVLQHVPEPHRVAGEVMRILKPGGVIYAAAPLIYPFHEDPDDYYRFSYKGLQKLFGAAECLESGFSRGPASTMLQLSVHYWSLILSFNNRYLHTLLLALFKYMFFWVKYGDVIFARYAGARNIHTASYFIGRKP